MLGQWKWAGAGNEPRRSIAREVVPGPLHQHQHSITELNHVHQMDKEPRQPGEEPGKPEPAQIHYGGGTADSRHRAAVFVFKRRYAAAFESGGDYSRDVTALLHGDGGHTRKWLSVPIGTIRQVANDKNLRVAWQGQVRLNNHSTGSVQLSAGCFGDNTTERRS